MEESNANYEFTDFPLPKLKRRRSLLPWWIVAFIWLFLVFFALIPVGIIMGLLHYNFQISLLGLSTNQPISLIGLFLILLFTLKGITAFGLWTEKDWGVGLAKIDAIISIVICFLVMAYPLFAANYMFSLRLELIPLFPYYWKMNKIQYDWENFGEQTSISSDF